MIVSFKSELSVLFQVWYNSVSTVRIAYRSKATQSPTPYGLGFGGVAADADGWRLDTPCEE